MWLDLFLVQISLIPLTVIEIYSSINPMHGLLLFFGGMGSFIAWFENGTEVDVTILDLVLVAGNSWVR